MSRQLVAEMDLDSPWAISGSAARVIRDRLTLWKHQPSERAADEARALQAASAGARFQGLPPEELYQVTNGIAVIRFEGVVSKRLSFWGWLFGGSASTEVFVQSVAAIRANVQTQGLRGAVMVVDSPGGCVRGTQAAADAWFALRDVLPTRTIVNGGCCSAAAWIALQSQQTYVSSAADEVGSIGALMVFPDSTRMELNVGIDTEIISSAPLKGTGYSSLTESQRAYWQRSVDEVTALFGADVARARSLSPQQLTAVLDARAYKAAEAQSLGLIDGIRTLEQLLGEMADLPSPVPITDASLTVDVPDDDETEDTCDATNAARKEQSMDENQIKALIAATVDPLKTQVEALTKENVALKASNEATAKQAADLANADGLRELLATATRENKIPRLRPENLTATITEAWAKDPGYARGLVAGLPVLGKRDGSVVAGTIATPAPNQGTGSKGVAAHPSDHVGTFLESYARYAPEKSETHANAIAYQERSATAGRPCSYRDAVTAVTRKVAA